MKNIATLILATALLSLPSIGFSGVGQKEVVNLSDYPRKATESTDNGRIKRWLDDEPRAVHRWAGDLYIASPGIKEHRPRHLEGVCGFQGNNLTGTRLIPVGEWKEDEAVLTLASSTNLRCLNIQAAVDGGKSETDPGYGLWIQKSHGSNIENLTVMGLLAGRDPDSNAAGRRWRGARRAGVFSDFFMSGSFDDVNVKYVEGDGILFSSPNAVSATDIETTVSHGNGVVIWGNKPHPWSRWPDLAASGSGFQLSVHGEGLDGWAVHCKGASAGSIRGKYVEATSGAVWLDNCRWWSVQMPRAGERPLRVTGNSWRVRIEWLLGQGTYTYSDGQTAYAPIELGYYISRDGDRLPIPENWLINLSNNWYGSFVSHGIKSDIRRIDYPQAK